MRPVIVAFSIVLLVSCGESRADKWYAFTEVRCDPADGSVAIAPDILQNEEPSKEWLGQLIERRVSEARTFRLTPDVDYGECVLSEDTVVRVRMGLGVFHEGEGGADPPQWVSVWVNRRKWISHQQLGGFGERNVVADVKVRADGVRICERSESESESACRAWTLPRSELPETADTAEYPSSGNRPRAGTIRVRESATHMCNTMLDQKERVYGHAAWEIRPPVGSTVEFPPASDLGITLDVHLDSVYREERFDANNDGVEDIVLSIHPATHAQDADVYFRVDADRYERLAQSKRTMNDFVHEALFTYPFGWADCCRTAPYVDGADNNYLDSRLPFTNAFNGTDIHWRPRYTHLVPFVYEGTTYFIVSTFDSWSRNVTYVVKPLADDSFKRICMFERVERNF